LGHLHIEGAGDSHQSAAPAQQLRVSLVQKPSSGTQAAPDANDQFLILELRILTPADSQASVRANGILNSRIKNGQTQ
jgi:hypothetical protein